MKKVLIIATIDEHIRHFHMPLINKLASENFTVDIASNGGESFENINNKYNIPFSRNPFKLSNLRAFIKLKKVIEENKYDYIHVNTPVGAAIGRLAALKSRQNGTKVIYTVHGFHFYKGAPIVNWCIFFPTEFFLSKYTDELIVINQEDYDFASQKLPVKKVRLVNGVGVDTNKFYPINNQENHRLRKEMGFKDDDILLIYVAELSKRKNQKLLVDVMSGIDNPKVKLLLIGKGALLPKLEDYAKKSKVENILFLGYRTNVSDYMKICNICVSSSKQEGLPVNIIEAQCSCLPTVVTNCRGNRDLVSENKNGYIIEFDQNTILDFREKIKQLINNKELREKLGQENLKHISKYSIENVLSEIFKVYEEI